MGTFYWQEGYAAFTVSRSQFDRVQQYVCDQPAHHRQRGFAEKVRALLDAHGIELRGDEARDAVAVELREDPGGTLFHTSGAGGGMTAVIRPRALSCSVPVGLPELSRSITPACGFGVSLVILAALRAAEFTQARWLVQSCRKTGLSGDTSSSILAVSFL